MKRSLGSVVAAGILATAAAGAAAQSPEQWIDWGQRVHGGFGVLIGVGIRIGQDALLHLEASRRELDVTYFDTAAAPCPCIVDGILVAVSASPGQKTLRVASQPAGPGLYGEALIAHRRTGKRVRYCVLPEGIARLEAAQKQRDFRVRYDAVMALPAEALFFRSGDADRCAAPEGSASR